MKKRVEEEKGKNKKRSKETSNDKLYKNIKWKLNELIKKKEENFEIEFNDD